MSCQSQHVRMSDGVSLKCMLTRHTDHLENKNLALHLENVADPCFSPSGIISLSLSRYSLYARMTLGGSSSMPNCWQSFSSSCSPYSAPASCGQYCGYRTFKSSINLLLYDLDPVWCFPCDSKRFFPDCVPGFQKTLCGPGFDHWLVLRVVGHLWLYVPL